MSPRSSRLHVASGATAAEAVVADVEHGEGAPVTVTPPVRLAAVPEIDPETVTGPRVPLSELVLVDQHEAQGWRVRQDERLDRLFEERCDWVRTYGRAGQLAVDAGDLTLTYDELDARSNQLARYLRLHGVSAGDRVALLFDRPVDAYVAVLGVLKIGAAYVPLHPAEKAERLAAIVADARVRTVLSTSDAVARVPRIGQLEAVGAELVHLDRAAPLIGEQDGRRLQEAERGTRDGQLAYISYPAGGEGRTGVAVDHRSIANFVKVAAEMYGIRPWDRVYQGVSIAFDFSVEEIWVPWTVGATLVPRPAGPAPRGAELHRFLAERRVTALCAVPGQLAALDGDLPDLRFLLVSGPACPPELVNRWHRPGRRFVNVYGPAEATVSALWTELDPDRPVTLGMPLPTYSTVVLDPADPFRALPHGEVGEIGIAGIGLACGYLDREDLTEQAFIPDFLGIPANPSGRIYRTGDLGRVTGDGEIEYHGRLGHRESRDYRTELDAIEAALLTVDAPQAPAIVAPEIVEPAIVAPVVAAPVVVAPVVIEPVPAAPVAPAALVPAAPVVPVAPVAPVAPAEIDGGLAATLAGELAEVLKVPAVAFDADFFDDLGADSMVMARFCGRLRKRDDLPTISIKDVYGHPSIADLVRLFAPAPAAPQANPAAAGLAAVLAEVLKVDAVPVDADFFDDLGADSMIMARFYGLLRKRDDLPTLSIKDVYGHPTIAALAATFAPPAAPAGGARFVAPEPPEPPMITTSLKRAQGALRGVRHRHQPARKPRYVLCAALQLLFFTLYSAAASYATFRGFTWIAAGADLLSIYERAALLLTGAFVGLSVVPVLAKWVLIGRWKPRQIRIWSMTYLRFWIVKSLVQRSPMVLFVGSPLYLVYLRALGAKIGRGVAIFSRNVPVCTDLLTVGDGTVIRRDAFFTGYRAHDGLIQTASVTLGRDVLVGEKTVLDIDTALGDGAQLGHTSSLHAGQSVPAGERWHGSPAVPTDTDYKVVEQRRSSGLRRVVYTAVQLVNLLVLVGPIAVTAVVWLFNRYPVLGALLDPTAPVLSLEFLREALIGSTLLFFGALLIGFVLTLTVPRLLNLALRPGRTYRLYGVHYWIHRLVTRLTNRRVFTELFGDSSFVVGYLRLLGYQLKPVVQTGSNFGMAVRHDNPYLSSVGSGTVVADGLSMVNSDYSATAFRVSRVAIGRNNFLGNNIAYPAQGRTGDNCLLATKVMVPIDGPVRENVGLLGSPSFEIPRSVQRDNSLDVASAAELRRRLGAKARHNLVSILLRLVVRWGYILGETLLASGTLTFDNRFGFVALLPFTLLSVAFTVVYYVTVERSLHWLEIVAPQGCSIYDRAFWRHERAWKVPSEDYFRLFDGTPFKNVIWRLLGVKVGRRVFDDGCFLTERSFVTLGDGCTLNAGTVIQCHSQEDGAFKSDRTVLGAGVTLGVGSFVHYGVTMGDRAVLAADSFLMKGEDVPAGALWGGNPAKKMREHAVDLRVRRISRRDGGVLVGSD